MSQAPLKNQIRKEVESKNLLKSEKPWVDEEITIGNV
jgi:hypothetical protein